MKLGGGDPTYTAYMQNGRGWADVRLSMVGGGGGDENENERGCQKKFNLFHLYFTKFLIYIHFSVIFGACPP